MGSVIGFRSVLRCSFQDIFRVGILFGLLSVRLFHFARVGQMVRFASHHHLEFLGNTNLGIPISSHHHLQYESGA